VAQTFGTEVILGLVGVATGIVTARLLGPGGKGQLALITIVVSLVFAFTQLGLPPAVVYFTKRVPGPQLVGDSLSLSAALGFAALVVGGTVTYLVVAPLLNLNRPLLLLALSSLPLLFLDGTADGIVQGNYRVTKFNILRLVNPCAYLLLLGGVVAVSDRVEVAVSLWVAAVAVSAVASVTTAVRGSGMRLGDLAPNWERWWSLLHFGLRTHVGNVLKYFQYRFDVVLIGALLDKRQVGLYVVGVSLAELPLHIPDAVGVVLFPKVAAMTAQQQRGETTPLVCRHTVLLTVTLSAVLFLVAPSVIMRLLGAPFEKAYIPARILLVGAIPLAVWKILAQDMIARGKPTAFSLSALYSLVTMVVGCVVLIPRLGLAGGAVASSIAYTAAAVSLLVFYHRLTGVPLRACVIIRRSDLALYVSALRRLRKAA